MESIFGVPFSDLTVDHLRRFLAEVGDEGLRWEAKGPDPRDSEKPLEARHVREAACALANSVGGYVVIGACQDERSRQWDLPGVRINHVEPGTWLDDAIGALRPRPLTPDPRVWSVEHARVAAVVEVNPVAVPPCMMPGGEIYERTSGKSVKVVDPAVLTRLFAMGEAARTRAETQSQRAIAAVENFATRESVNVRLGMSATAYEDDIASRLFAGATGGEPAMVYRLDDVVSSTLRPDRYHQGPTAISRMVRQEAHVIFTGPGAFAQDPRGGNHLWVVRPAWDGSAGIACTGNEQDIGIDLLLGDIIVPAWRAAGEVVRLLGGYGPVYLMIEVLDGFKLADDRMQLSMPRTIVSRWLDSPATNEGDAASIKRELLRAAGSGAWEESS